MVKIPFISKKEPVPIQITPTVQDADVEKRRSTDQIDLISRFIEVDEEKPPLSADYIKMPADANREEFIRSMTKCAVQAQFILEQGAAKYVEHTKNSIDLQDARGALAQAWGHETYSKWRKDALEKAEKDAAIAIKLGELARKLIAAEPHMVATLNRNVPNNVFAKGAFEGDKASKDKEEEKDTLSKLSGVLGRGGKA